MLDTNFEFVQDKNNNIFLYITNKQVNYEIILNDVQETSVKPFKKLTLLEISQNFSYNDLTEYIINDFHKTLMNICLEELNRNQTKIADIINNDFNDIQIESLYSNYHSVISFIQTFKETKIYLEDLKKLWFTKEIMKINITKINDKYSYWSITEFNEDFILMLQEKLLYYYNKKYKCCFGSTLSFGFKLELNDKYYVPFLCIPEEKKEKLFVPQIIENHFIEDLQKLIDLLNEDFQEWKRNKEKVVTND
jgi:hypothetical protein